MVSIHPSAVIESGAELGYDVSIGPFCYVQSHSRLGDRCQLSSHVVIERDTQLGVDNIVGPGTVLGGRPQHLLAEPRIGALVIGDRNTFRENVTVHRALKRGVSTIIGNDNYLMVQAHVGHDCVLENHIILANNVMLGGHVEVQSHAFVSGAVGVHQFCRVGAHTMVGGQARVTQDVPPFFLIDGATNAAVGINRIGLRRRNFSRTETQQVKEAYRIFYGPLSWKEKLSTLRKQFPEGPAARIHQFCETGERGFVQQRKPSTTTLRIFPDQGKTVPLAKAG